MPIRLCPVSTKDWYLCLPYLWDGTLGWSARWQARFPFIPLNYTTIENDWANTCSMEWLAYESNVFFIVWNGEIVECSIPYSSIISSMRPVVHHICTIIAASFGRVLIRALNWMHRLCAFKFVDVWARERENWMHINIGDAL